MNKKQLQSIIREEVREAMQSTSPSTGNFIGRYISGMGPRARNELAKVEGLLMDVGFFQGVNETEIKELAELIFNMCQEHRRERNDPSMKTR